jgi:outer membrane protein assembly factor BamB
MVAIASKDGRVLLLPSTLGTAAFKTPAAASEIVSSGLATWQDSDGTRWLLSPAASSVVAWKVVDKGGAPSMEQGWSSRDLVSPLPPMVINGVVFAVSSGEFRSKDAKTTVSKSSHAVLYALDARTGKELWSSGNTITSFIHSGGLSGGASQLYLQTHDGTLYAFGFPIEH